MCSLMHRLVLSLLRIDFQDFLDTHRIRVNDTQGPGEDVRDVSSISIGMRRDCERYEACLYRPNVLPA